jgi:hypothetical protein
MRWRAEPPAVAHPSLGAMLFIATVGGVGERQLLIKAALDLIDPRFAPAGNLPAFLITLCLAARASRLPLGSQGPTVGQVTRVGCCRGSGGGAEVLGERLGGCPPRECFAWSPV